MYFWMKKGNRKFDQVYGYAEEFRNDYAVVSNSLNKQEK